MASRNARGPEDGKGEGALLAENAVPSDLEEPQITRPDVLAGGWWAYLRRSTSILLEERLNLLMLATPFAIVSRRQEWGDGLTFALALVAICPFAERISFVTEQLAMYTNDTLGGLLNRVATASPPSPTALAHRGPLIIQAGLGVVGALSRTTSSRKA